jgi:hypothetical protein
MRISKRHRMVRLLLVLLMLGMLAFLGVSCKTQDGPQDGTLTVKLVNATGHDGHNFGFAVFKEGADWILGSPEANGHVDVAGGEAQATAMDLATGTTVVVFTGGANYFIGAMVDEDDSNGPTGGDYLYIGSVFTIDGNRTETLDLASFSIAGFTLSGSLTKSGITNGRYAYTKLVAQGGAPTDAALYWARSTAFSGGTATYSIIDITQANYTQYIFIDTDADAAGDATSLPDSGDWGGPGAVNVTMNSDQTSDFAEGSWNQIP